MVFLRTKYDSYGTVLVCTTFKAVKQRQIIVHLSCILWFESTDFQVNSNKTTQSTMEKQHIYLTFLSVILQYMLVAYEREPIAEFHKETCDGFYKTVFKFKLQDRTCHSQEAEIIATAEHLVGILRLFGRKSAVEIVICPCQCLRLIHVEFNGIE